MVECARLLSFINSQPLTDIKACQKEHKREKCEGCKDYPKEWVKGNDKVVWPSG